MLPVVDVIVTILLTRLLTISIVGRASIRLQIDLLVEQTGLELVYLRRQRFRLEHDLHLIVNVV